METIFEASNSVEAYMVLNLLQQAGLSGRVDGEYLPGGAGELQAVGLVRVKVDKSDYEAAKTIIQQWDAMRPSEEEPAPAKISSHVGTGIFGLLSGAMITALFYNTPITRDGIDHNDDGILDEKWTLVDGYISKVEVDRNFDGAPDYHSKYDRSGTIVSAESDQDFNGTFESSLLYENGDSYKLDSDTNGDGFKDMQLKFKYGVLETITFLNPDSKKAIKVEHYASFKQTSADVDTTGDGILDSVYEYNDIGDVVNKSRKQSN